LAFSQDGKTLASDYERDGGAGGIMLWDVATRKKRDRGGLRLTGGRLGGLGIAADGTIRAAIINETEGVELWDARGRTGVIPVREAPISFSVNCTAFSPDGRTLAVGYSGSYATRGGFILWDAEQGRVIFDGFLHQPYAINEMVFSPDGTTLATVFERRREGGYGSRLVADDEDSRLISAGREAPRDHLVSLWDLAGSGRFIELSWIIAERERDPRGRNVAFADNDRFIVGSRMYDIRLQSWVQRADEIVNRNFTRDEWRQFFPGEDYRPTFPELPIPLEGTSNSGTRTR
jgi:hypothetical protein